MGEIFLLEGVAMLKCKWPTVQALFGSCLNVGLFGGLTLPAGLNMVLVPQVAPFLISLEGQTRFKRTSVNEGP